MTKKVFIPSVNEDLNRPYNVTLTEGQISTILYHLEGKDGEEVDNIFEELEGVVDAYYDKVSEAQSKQPVAEW